MIAFGLFGCFSNLNYFELFPIEFYLLGSIVSYEDGNFEATCSKFRVYIYKIKKKEKEKRLLIIEAWSK